MAEDITPPETPSSEPEKSDCLVEKDKAQSLLDEAIAMAEFISRRGDVLGKGNLTLHSNLLKAIKDVKCSENYDAWVKLHEAYAQVTAITYGSGKVNGRTILDTNYKGEYLGLTRLISRRNRPEIVGVIFFIAALFFKYLADWVSQTSDPNTELTTEGSKLLYEIANALLAFLIPAVWGGIGACIFLMKRLSDKLFEQAFEYSAVRGDMTRIFLGSMLGVIVVVVIFPGYEEAIKVGNFTFGPTSAAFIAGLGVKPVYAAFESLSEKLAAYFNNRN